MMDLNKDGVLDKFEFILAQRSLGYSFPIALMFFICGIEEDL